jgi:hypothetical protein
MNINFLKSIWSFVCLFVHVLFYFILFSMIEEKNQKYSNINVKKEVVKEVEDPNMWAFDDDLVQNNKSTKPNKNGIFSSKTER